MNEMFYGGETVHYKTKNLVVTFRSECKSAFGRGGGTYAS